ncbi:hypothetical protein HPB51_028320 [Rhipicephalus microplus]|uniref:RRM domain-containing protein n=1 Tax=Rhipicephalus microplus TaxID=6941 RepID=A0A9J6CY58_RHIMP|nr:hypothetical protein HPB51_028320 [Rhipicephalus microplus]
MSQHEKYREVFPTCKYIAQLAAEETGERYQGRLKVLLALSEAWEQGCEIEIVEVLRHEASSPSSPEQVRRQLELTVSVEENAESPKAASGEDWDTSETADQNNSHDQPDLPQAPLSHTGAEPLHTTPEKEQRAHNAGACETPDEVRKAQPRENTLAPASSAGPSDYMRERLGKLKVPAKEKELRILSCLVPQGLLSEVQQGKLLLGEDQVETIPSRIPETILDEEVHLDCVQKYFTEDGWTAVLATVKIKEERLREFFSTKGTVTDLQLKYTKEGVFRRFAFVGFKDEAQAAAAKEYFNNSYLDTSKLQVEICAALGDEQKPRSWSKYSADSSAYQRLHPETRKPKPVKEKSPRKNFADEFLKDLEGNEEFEEFLKVHGTHNKVTWDNDTRAPNADGDAKKAKPAKAVPPSKSEDEDGDDADEEEPKDNFDKAPASSKAKKNDKQQPVPQQKQKPKLPVQEFAYTLKVKGLPYNCKKKQIKDFFKPAKVASLRLPPKVRGIAYLGFKKEQDMKQALNKHHSFMAGHRLDVTKYAKQVVPEKKWRQFEDLGNPQETLADVSKDMIACSRSLLIGFQKKMRKVNISYGEKYDPDPVKIEADKSI